MQDGYAVRSADGAGEFDVEFEQLAGSTPGQLSEGKIAYITTGNIRDPAPYIAGCGIRGIAGKTRSA